MAKKGKNAEIVGKSVSFNILDPDQNADLKFAEERTNFSAFVKHLIRVERLRRQQGRVSTEELDRIMGKPKEVEVADDDSMKGFI